MALFLAAALDLNRLPLFSLGRVVATRGALELLKATNTDPAALLARHVTGDWGDCNSEDAQTNRDALEQGLRVMSVYRLPLAEAKLDDSIASLAHGRADETVWIITEADRSATTLLLPEEY